MIITISGQIGAGKSTLAKEIAERFNLKYISAGRIMRDMAREKGMSLMELSKFAELNSYVDRKIDETQKELAKNENCVVEGRISAYFFKPDLKIFLIAPLDVRARRVSKRDNIHDIKSAIRDILKREDSERKRYKKIYGFNFDNFDNFDVILNTAVFNQEKLVEIISGIIEKI